MFLSSLLLVLALLGGSCVRGQDVDFYLEVLAELHEDFVNFVQPTNADEFSSTDTTSALFGTFDFVVVGGGAGGSVVANRLSEVAEWNILVLEPGDFWDNVTDVPLFEIPLQFDLDRNWAYQSTPQPTSSGGMVDNVINYPQGKGVGGTTLINGLVYSRGQNFDFDNWAALGNTGWAYEDVLPLFKKSEHFAPREPGEPFDPAFHGTDGFLNVEYVFPNHPFVDAYLAANGEIGIPTVDYNANLLGVSPSQYNTIIGRREDDGKAFIGPALGRSNLQILTGAFATKVLIDECSLTATGVEFTYQGHLYTVNTNKEVILSAGALKSPQLLMLSGIGPAAELEEFDIPVLVDSPVGLTLRDQPFFIGLIYETNHTEPQLGVVDVINKFLNGTGGPFANPNNGAAVGFYESSFTTGTGIADVEMLLIPPNITAGISQASLNLKDDTYEDFLADVDILHSFTIYISCLHANSVGDVRIKSNDPFDYVLVNPNMLSDPEDHDIQVILDGIDIIQQFIATDAFAAFNTTLASKPLRACSDFTFNTTPYWTCAIRQLTIDLHPMGTNPMGVDRATSVVDPTLNVHGVNNLRVIDSSIFPTTFAGHPNAPTILAAEIGTNAIKAKYGVCTMY